MPGAPPPAPTPLVGFALTYNTKDAGPTTVTGAANVSFVSSRVQLPAEDGDVAAAAAIQTAADADAECLRLIGRGEQAAAVAKKEASIETLSALLRELGKEPRYRDSCCVRLAQVLERSRRTLEGLRRGKETRALEMEMRYEMRVQRAMSDNGMEERADSEDGAYSDAGSDDGGSPRRNVRRRSSSPVPSLGYGSGGSGSDGSLSPPGSPPMMRAISLEQRAASLGMPLEAQELSSTSLASAAATLMPITPSTTEYPPLPMPSEPLPPTAEIAHGTPVYNGVVTDVTP